MTISREIRFKQFLPAALLLVVYSLLVNPGVQRELSDARSRLETKRREAVTNDQLLDVKLRVARLQREVNELQPAKEKLRGELAGVLGPSTAHLRVEAVELLSGLFNRHELRLIEAAPVEGPEAKLPKSLEQAFKRLDPTGAPKAPLVWRAELSGGYLDVLALLDELAGSNLDVIPLGISMAPADINTVQRKWTLLVAI